jgi:bifunctional non-homologous end joining protein LigD
VVVNVDGRTMLDIARQRRLEGIVAKRLDSPLQTRPQSGLGEALLRKRTEVLVGGWTSGEGRRAGRLGALLLGVHDADGELVYIGDVGAGRSDTMLDQLAERLKPLGRRDSRSRPRFRAIGPGTPTGSSPRSSARSSTAPSP